MSEETIRENEHEPEPTGEVTSNVATSSEAAPPRPPAVRCWEITLSPELDAALHVKAI